MNMEKKIDLSVIIPVYNTEKYVKKCLDSLFSQTLQQLEVIVVNNGSSGNIDEIVMQYKKDYPERLLKLVKCEKNQGTFHGRGKGMEAATGEYFTFMDADDRVGVDYYYSMICAAHENNCEIVMCDMVHEDENGYQFRYIEDPLRDMNINIHGNTAVFEKFYRFSGLSYSMYGIWNKIYKRCLWDRALPFIEAIKDHFALCEDAAYTTIFFSFADSACNIHDQYYYHFVHSESASGSLAVNPAKVKRNCIYQGTAFRNMKGHLKRAGIYEEYKECFLQFRRFHHKVMLFHISNGKFSLKEKEMLKKYCNDQFGEEMAESLTDEELFFTNHFVEQTPDLEMMREDIVLGESNFYCIDINNALLLSHFSSYQDMYKAIQSRFEELTKLDIDFCTLRSTAENDVKKSILKSSNYEAITVDDIYEWLSQKYRLTEETCKTLKEYEINIFKESVFVRNITKKLIDLMRRSGKKIVFVVDSVYGEEVFKEILQRNNISNYKSLWCSASCHLSIVEGTMLNAIKNKYNRSICFYSSNIRAIDYASSLNYSTKYIPKVEDILLRNLIRNYYGGDFYLKAYGHQAINDSYDVRTLGTLMANRIFDNPYVRFDYASDYNANPFLIGYTALGPYLVGAMQWLLCELKIRDVHEILIRDSNENIYHKILKRLCELENYELTIRDDHVVDEGLLSLPPIKTMDDLFRINIKTNLGLYTPRKLIACLCVRNNIHKKDCIEIYRSLEEEKVLIDKSFVDNETFYKTVNVLSRFFEKNIEAGISEKNVFVSGTNKNALWCKEAEHFYSLVRVDGKQVECYEDFEKSENERNVYNAFLAKPEYFENFAKQCVHNQVFEGVEEFLYDFCASYINTGLNIQNIGSKLFEDLINNGQELDCTILSPFWIDVENRDKGRISDFWRVHRLNGKSVAAYEPGLGFYYQKQKSIPQKVLLLMLCDKGILKEK